MLSDTEREQFIRLVDSGAPLKRYSRELKLSKEDFDYHLFFLSYYRLFFSTRTDMLRLLEEKRTAAPERRKAIDQEINKLRLSLKELWKELNEQLSNSRSKT